MLIGSSGNIACVISLIKLHKEVSRKPLANPENPLVGSLILSLGSKN